MGKGMLHIFGKEFKNYFVSPIAYIIIAIFVGISGFLFFSTFFINNQATLRNFFGLLPLFFAILIPLMTMHLFSEELNLGSYELLLTLPVTFIDIIMGKFLASLSFVGIALLPTLSYPIFIATISNLDWGPVIGGYVGVLLLSSAYCAIGLFASSLTRNQIVSAIVSFAVCFMLWLFGQQIMSILPPFLYSIVQYSSTEYHFQNIAKGVIDIRDILYFASICFIAMFATKLVMEEKK